MITKETADKVNRRLSDLYGDRWKTEIGITLYDEFKTRLSDKEYIEAIRRHLLDPENGKYPPLPADIERPLRQMFVKEYEQKKQRQAEKQQQRLTASGEILEQLDWRKQFAFWAGKRQRIETALKTQLGLRFQDSEDREVWQHVMKAFMRSEGNFTVPQALAIGAEFQQQQRGTG